VRSNPVEQAEYSESELAALHYGHAMKRYHSCLVFRANGIDRNRIALQAADPFDATKPHAKAGYRAFFARNEQGRPANNLAIRAQGCKKNVSLCGASR
jgi:hypothetical protein